MKHTTGYSSREFVVDQVFNSHLLCKRLQRFTQLKHTKSLWLLSPQKKLLVLRCKKTDEC